MLPEQISKVWDEVAPLIEMSLPPIVHDRRQRMVNVLKAILIDELVIWFYYNEQKEFTYLVGTKVDVDDITNTRTLLIYCFASMQDVSTNMFRRGLKKLAQYAQGQKCTSIRAYVADPTIKKLFQRYGANIEYTLIDMEI